jgi:hypothetical protein
MSRLSYHSPCASCPREAGAAQRGPFVMMIADGEHGFLYPMASQPKPCMFQVEQTGGWAAGVAA